MKRKFLLSLVCLFSILFARAQTSLTTATDFTVTDTDGNTHNLFSILNSGKYVCINFFSTACSPCQSTGTYYKETITNFGCNSQDIFFISIDQGDNNAEVQTCEIATLRGATNYPAVSGTQGGGNAVNTAYSPGGYPTYVLIAPNKQIVQQDMWPINDAGSFTTYFNNHSLAPKTCLSSGIAKQTSHETPSVYPNPAINTLTIEASNNDKLSNIKVYDVLGNVLVNKALNMEKRHEVDVTLFEKGVYFVEISTANNEATIKKFNKL